MEFLKKVNKDFRELLSGMDPVGQMATLTGKMVGKGMEMEGDPFPTFLKPYFVDMRERKAIAHATEKIMTGLEKVGAEYMAGNDFDGLIHLHGRTAELAEVDPLYPNFQVMVRLDVFYHPDTGEMKFIEVNCGDPSGMGWHDAMLDFFLELPILKAMGEKYDLHTDHLLVTHKDALLDKYRQYCATRGIAPKSKPRFAIVCDRDSTILGDVNVVVEYYEKMGQKAVFADPRDFDYDGEKLSLNGEEIDIIYRDALEDFIHDNFWVDCQNAINAYRDGKVCFVNPVRAATGDFKTLTAVMSDDKYKDIFDEEEWEVMQRCIPWTRLLRESTTTFRGETIDLVKFALENKDTFVLKPNEGYGGFGIYIGTDCTEDEWRKAVDSALGADYAIQEFVKIPREEFPVVEGGEFTGFELKNVNINYWSHGGKFAGAFLRAAAGNIINVHQGGGLVPVIFVSEKK